MTRFGGHLISGEPWCPEEGVCCAEQLSAEFRRQMVELVRAGRTPEELAKEFQPSAQSIRTWVRQADLDDGRRQDGLTSADKDELARLRRENKILREWVECSSSLNVGSSRA
ncbi:transposase [Nonomuraea aurantiaca]|uniref:transposase n=1 Tax=Nonomuraea aurantiaca TaxID=2878562 RepID=UPI001CD9A3C8|nr:transposase [Nonomuraea aurantiaca]MCA2230488.1 transposase [Nonomuraea aurantiaca]